MLYIYTKLIENIIDGIKAMERTGFPLENFQGGLILQKIEGGVTVLFSGHRLSG